MKSVDQLAKKAMGLRPTERITGWTALDGVGPNQASKRQTPNGGGPSEHIDWPMKCLKIMPHIDLKRAFLRWKLAV